jgi:hypothetical protein
MLIIYLHTHGCSIFEEFRFPWKGKQPCARRPLASFKLLPQHSSSLHNRIGLTGPYSSLPPLRLQPRKTRESRRPRPIVRQRRTCSGWRCSSAIASCPGHRWTGRLGPFPVCTVCHLKEKKQMGFKQRKWKQRPTMSGGHQSERSRWMSKVHLKVQH